MAWCMVAPRHHMNQYWSTYISLWPSETIWQQIWVNIGSGNGLLPDGTKPLPDPVLIDHQWSLAAFTWPQFHMKCSRYRYLIWVSKFINSRLQPHLPRANELNHICLWAISLEMPRIALTKMCFNIAHSKFQSHLPWANKLVNSLAPSRCSFNF